MLILPPAPERWEPLKALLGADPSDWMEDLQRRLGDGPAGARDAFAIIPDGGNTLAHACIRRCGEFGVLGHMFTHENHRRRGLARSLVQTLLSWFDMTGGRWAYAYCPTPLLPLLEPFGFYVLHRPRSVREDVALVRPYKSSAGRSPYETLQGDWERRALTAADWPALVCMLQHLSGPDPRVALVDSALGAAQFALDLVRQEQRGACRLLGEFRGGRLLAAASISLEPPAPRTYAMVMPPQLATAELREDVTREAALRGYSTVDFPLERLATSAPRSAGG